MQISVIMPAYNAEKYISEAIESVLSQTYKDFELIIINDGSTDNTLSIIESFAEKDPRINILSHSNIGLCETLNKGIRKAKNEWIIMMHADDIMLHNRIERQLIFIQSNPDIAITSSLVYYIDKKGRVFGRCNISKLETREDFNVYMLKNKVIGFHHPAVALKKSVALEAGGYRTEYWPAEDIDLWNRISERNHLLLVQQEYLLKYRIHGSSASIYNSRMIAIKTRLIKENILRRRRGLEELSLETFLYKEKQKPLFYRINRARKDFAKIFYKRGTYFYSNQDLFNTILNTFIALLLQPLYVSKQILNKLINYHLDKRNDLVDF